MKKTASKFFAIALSATMLLSGCSNASTPSDGNTGNTSGDNNASQGSNAAGDVKPISELIIPKVATRELETFNILQSQRAEDFENLCNLTDPLLEVDEYGKLQPCIASEWGTEDGGVTWTFKLREGVKWVDMNGNEKADCTAQDFLTGLEWVLNFHKNDSANTSMPLEMIKGAQEYYEYTKTLGAEEAKALKADGKFLEMVGISAPDAHTLVYTCMEAKPYFDSVATYACLYPISQAMIDELGGVDGVKKMNNENMWYNGCYTMTNYIMNNEKTFTKNPTYWDKEAYLFDTVTIRMVESNDVAFQLYQTGEIDHVDLTESNVKTISGNQNHEFYNYMVETRPSKYSYQMHFNYNKNKEDGTPDENWNKAVANEAFRLSWWYGLDLKDYYKRTNAINPMKCENNFYTMPGLVYDSTGKEYTQIVREKMGLPEANGESMVRLNKEKAEQYKKQAMEELSALGVTFPVGVDYYVSSKSQTSIDSANVLKQCFSSSLGDDYVTLNVKTFINSTNSEVVEPSLHSFVINGWGADYGDPQNYLGQECYLKDNAYYSKQYSKMNSVTEETEATKDLIATYKEYTSMVEAADAIHDDMDARYNAYADAEVYLLEHALVLPCNYNPGWCLTKINPYSKMNAMYGCQNDKMKNWETSQDGFTTEQVKAFEAEYNAAMKK